MRSLSSFLLLLVLGAWMALVQAQLGQAIAELPASVPQSSCSLLDQACMCANEPLQAEITLCVKAGCTAKEQLHTLRVTSSMCGHEVRDRRQLLWILTIVLGCMSPVFVGTRLATRLFIAPNGTGWSLLSSDDWCIVATLAMGIPSTIVIATGLIPQGHLGMDIWMLEPATIENFGRYFYTVEVLYFAELMLLKMSLLFFYLRIFPSRGVRRILWATIIFNGVYGVAFVLVGIFQCNPISYFWTKWDGEHQGKCINVNAMAWSNAAISIALDLWMLAVPMWQLRTLRMHWKKKIGVGAMFVVGTLITVVSVLRLQSLVDFASSDNPTQTSWDVTFWSLLEIKVGIFCACMPTLRLLLVRIFPRLGGTTVATSSGYVKDSAGNRRRGGTGGGGASWPAKSDFSISASASRSRTGTVSNVLSRNDDDAFETAGQKSPAAQQAHEVGGIKYQRSYKVSYVEQGDEERLVQMQDLRPGSTHPPAAQAAGTAW
ncbi:hypothetical protein MCOR27_005240 [Pyricularia oryzae]|uniref:Extracellular membrane protein CFEM domain-containing protein n=1 Tax=Pyricularia grisea TaxID=148305 RepID=A0ABQ8P202_PYRGI|nr:hypothetical protein MCOR01_000261 [Pyricularia oryzae]KAI6304851.1 hypothetical protein MCOR33_000364 [Pyricularia grisea]KAI6255206.1 hypothetical protein MCOR19_008283 [Pyricularia oryzae]KAI6279236.1 hypothetical protein MCOR27_005240 [Pyricularia oryzae]KAI6287645.1 hypothetical protein MCOR26_000545 [Pyricularia oryzae]